MLRYFLLLCFCLPMATSYACDDDWEDDEDEYDEYYDEYCSAAPTTVSYGGIEMACPAGCGDEESPEVEKIHTLFQQCCDQTINSFGYGSYDHENYWNWNYSTMPWDGRSDGEYRVLNPFNQTSLELSIEGNYTAFLDVFAHFERDLAFYHEQTKLHNQRDIRKLESRLTSLIDKSRASSNSEAYEDVIASARYDLEQGCNYSSVIEQTHSRALQIADETFQKIDSLFKEIFIWCLQHHQPEGIAFRAALEQLMLQDTLGALEQIRALIALGENHFSDQLLAKLYLLQGQVQSEAACFADAIVALSAAIQKNPAQKEAYFERAYAYLELGNFDRAIEDYLHSGFQKMGREKLLQWGSGTQLGFGITAGILQGAMTGAGEFVPGILTSLRGLSQGAWAFCSHPVGASQAFGQAAMQLVDYLKTRPPAEILQDLVPELRELIQHSDTLDDYQQGQLIGTIVGKYGVDILLGKYGLKTMTAFVDLKRANRMMTLEAVASRGERKALEEATRRYGLLREEYLNTVSRKIQWDKQGKHMPTHRNYDPERTRSVFHEIPQQELQQLVQNFAGTGIVINGQKLGAAGCKEVVNFERVIGYHVDERSKIKTPTSWVKIHYAKDGVHVVPTLPPQY